LVELAKQLPASQVEYFSGDVDVNQPDLDKYPLNGLSVLETIRNIEENRSWMLLRNIETVPEYARLVRDVLDQAYSQVGSVVRDIHREESFIIVSSPNSVTPFHVDEDHNFLLQIQGSKEVSWWDPLDRVVLPEDLAEYHLQIWHGEGFHKQLPFQNEFQDRATVFKLSPGEGMYLPMGAPHWVKNGPKVSISISLTFRSSHTERQAILYFVNRKLRSLGLNPIAPRQSSWRDSVKYLGFQAGRRTAKLGLASWLNRNQKKWA
jgi:hypothetical protein